jgi:hypothetical protein
VVVDDSQKIDLPEQMAIIIDRCLQSEAAYKLFVVLGSIAVMSMDVRREFILMISSTGIYEKDDVQAISKLLLSGKAAEVLDSINQVRKEQVLCEITEMLHE